MYTDILRKIVMVGQWFAGHCSGDGTKPGGGGSGHCS